MLFPLINPTLSTSQGKCSPPRGSGKAQGHRACKRLAGAPPRFESRLVCFCYKCPYSWGVPSGATSSSEIYRNKVYLLPARLWEAHSLETDKYTAPSCSDLC